MRSPAGWREVPCAECGTFVEGIEFGERCAACDRRRRRRAERIASRVGIAAALLMALWTLWQAPHARGSRWLAGAAIAATFLLVRFIAKRIAMEAMR